MAVKEAMSRQSVSLLAVNPLLWGGILALAAAVFRRRRAVAVSLAALALLVPLAFATPRVARWVDREARSLPAVGPPEGTYDAVVVLTGSAPARLLRACEAVRNGRARHLLISGRMSDGERRLTDETLRTCGVPASVVVREPDSRSTQENARRSAAVVAQRGWHSLILVTDPRHMPRALACFAAAGLRPLPAPSPQPEDVLEGEWSPSRCALRVSTLALHELIGRAECRVSP